MTKPLKKISLFIGSLAVLILILNIPVSTRQGIDYDVTSRKMPLYVKASAFIYRDFEYRDLSRRITVGIDNDRDKIAAIYGWMIKNIREVPSGFPIVDDHIWNIIVRGYGAVDQRADVFTTLAGYAGYEACWDNLPLAGTKGGLLTLAFVKIDKRWYAFDVHNKKEFIDLEDESVLAPDGLSYSQHFKKMDEKSFELRWRRPSNQKIIPRIIGELKKIF